MAEILNATCAICGTKYHMCNTCKNIESFQPWRTVTDTLPHYLIYLALSEYTRTGNKDKAKEELEKCDLSELENFDKDIKRVIKEIFKKENVSKVETERTSTKFSTKKISVKSKEDIKNDIE